PNSLAFRESASKIEDDSTTVGNELYSGRVSSQASTSKPFTFGIFKSNSSSLGRGYRTRSLNGGVPFKYSIVAAPSGISIIWCRRPAFRNAHRSKYTSSRLSSANSTQCCVVIKNPFHFTNQLGYLQQVLFRVFQFAQRLLLL